MMPTPPTPRRASGNSPKGNLQVKVGSLVRELRDRRGLSQTELGKPLFSRAHVSAVELGKVGVSLPTLAFFAERLKVRLRDLIPDE